MTAAEIQDLVDRAAFPGEGKPIESLETHISWIILTPEFAFKIKKPLQLEFLDFSTVDLRRHFCQEELRLNRRLAPDMYLDVLPVGLSAGRLCIGASDLVVDYALQMRRIDSARQMDILVQKNAVGPQQIAELAAVLAPFHLGARMAADPKFSTGMYWSDFADLYRLQTDVGKNLGRAAADELLGWQAFLPQFLSRHSARLYDRRQQGYWVDGHGDLHTRNIFLPEGQAPIVFDCIEFSPHFRQTDILNELAFLCMDLETEGRPDLAQFFLEKYGQHWPLFSEKADRLLFVFFKAYRANVRLKVQLLALQQQRSPDLEQRVEQYWKSLSGYVRALQNS